MADMDPDTEDSFNELVADGVDIEDYEAVFFALSDFSGETSQVRKQKEFSIYAHMIPRWLMEEALEDDGIEIWGMVLA